MLLVFIRQAECLQGRGQNISLLSASTKGKKKTHTKKKRKQTHITSDFNSMLGNIGMKLAIIYAYPVLKCSMRDT